jgi:hypothetical protein
MTVRNTNYSSLEEVWGDSGMTKPDTSKHSKRTKDKREKREKTEPPKVVDPICELYEMGNYRGYNENDIITYANEYHNKYFEHDKQFDTEPPRYAKNDEEQIRGEANYYSKDDQVGSQQRAVVIERPSKPPSQQDVTASYPRRQKEPKYNYDDEDGYAGYTEFAFIDLLLYIISGVILIFVMEQFVKIGLLLQ